MENVAVENVAVEKQIQFLEWRKVILLFTHGNFVSPHAVKVNKYGWSMLVMLSLP